MSRRLIARHEARTDAFDYRARADLFLNKSTISRRKPLEYKSFRFARDAIRYVIEELAPERLGGLCMEIDEGRFSADAIRQLYESAAYPLIRKSGTGARTRAHRARETVPPASA